MYHLESLTHEAKQPKKVDSHEQCRGEWRILFNSKLDILTVLFIYRCAKHGCWLVCPLNLRKNTRDAKPVRSYHVISLIQVSSLPLSVSGAPVAVGMNIDIASIDMVSEVNMVRSADIFFWLETSGEDAVGKCSLNDRAYGKM